MAKAKIREIKAWKAAPKKKRPGIHAKTKTGTHKHSKTYVKTYVGQGR